MPTSSLRALTTFDRLPDGHATFLMNNDGHAPHLDIGEFAVVNTADRWLEHRLIGRVVGVSSRPLGNLLRPAAD